MNVDLVLEVILAVVFVFCVAVLVLSEFNSKG